MANLRPDLNSVQTFNYNCYLSHCSYSFQIIFYNFPPQAIENIPERTVSAIFHLCLDFPFSLTFPSIHESAVAYLEQSNSENHSLYSRISQAANTMEATCSFLKEVQAAVMLRKRKKNLDTIITTAFLSYCPFLAEVCYIANMLYTPH